METFECLMATTETSQPEDCHSELTRPLKILTSTAHGHPLSPQFRREEDAERAVTELNNRWFNGQAVHAELSPVTDFRESCCRQYEMGYGRAEEWAGHQSPRCFRVW